LRVLQVVSDWKWTGPAEPMLVLTRALRARGHEVELLCPEPPPGANRSLWEEACLRGVVPLGRIEGARGALRPGDRAEVERIAGWIGGPGRGTTGGAAFDVVHCWHSRDHLLAARALGRGLPIAGKRRECTLVRSLSGADRVAAWPWNRWLLGPACDGLLCVSRAAVEANRGLRGGRSIAVLSGAVESERLEVGCIDAARVRAGLGVPDRAPLIGVVARIQSHRRFDLLLGAMKRLVRDRPDARLVLIGRGSRAEEVAREPARRMGLETHVIFAGYRGEDYAAWLRALDVFCFLVPGSDGSCRALLEAATVGLPLVGTRRGAIPEIIRDGITGCLVEEDPSQLAAVWGALIADESRRRALSGAAARDALQRFTPARLARSVEGFYAAVRGGRDPAQSGGDSS
jgi:glycosyltransferase involved in cell wall biosynthesis